jgi:hypothetical protein
MNYAKAHNSVLKCGQEREMHVDRNALCYSHYDKTWHSVCTTTVLLQLDEAKSK